MAEYLTHDLILNLGEDMPEDLTLNMLRFSLRGTTLVIARSPVANEKTLDDALEDQLRMLRNKSKTMTISPTQVAHLGADEHTVEARELCIKFMVGDKPNYQQQAACLIPGEQRLLVLNYSKPSPLSDNDVEHWRTIKQKLRFA